MMICSFDNKEDFAFPHPHKEINPAFKSKSHYLQQLLSRVCVAECLIIMAGCAVLLQALPKWAQETLARHSSDSREVKSMQELEEGRTGDAIWDAMQHQLKTTGKPVCYSWTSPLHLRELDNFCYVESNCRRESICTRKRARKV
jgi:hypothetical protein